MVIVLVIKTKGKLFILGINNTPNKVSIMGDKPSIHLFPQLEVKYVVWIETSIAGFRLLLGHGPSQI